MDAIKNLRTVLKFNETCKLNCAMHYYDVEGSLICSEDNDDNNKYLVTQYDVEQAIFNGEYIPVPTESVINQMDKVYE